MSKPTVNVEHVEGESSALLEFHDLAPEHIELLRPVLLVNGDDYLHHLRADAGAHVERWTPEDGVVAVRMHKTETGMFMGAMCRLVGIDFSGVPNDPRWGIKS